MSDWAAIYSTKNVMLDPDILKGLEGNANVQVRVAPSARVSRQLHVDCREYNLTINVMNAQDVPEHIDGFLGWLTAVHEARGPFEDQGEQVWSNLMDWVATTRQVLGIVIEPHIDTASRCKSLVRGIAEFYDGIIFANDAIYLSTGQLIIGPDNAQDYI